MKRKFRKERKEAFIKAYQEEMRKQGLMDNPKYGEKDVVLNETNVIEVPYSLDEIVIEPVITEEEITAEAVENTAEVVENIVEEATVEEEKSVKKRTTKKKEDK